MCCDRCGKQLPFPKPFATCNTVTWPTYEWRTYQLCDKCLDELFEFLGPCVSNMEEE